MMSIDRLLNCCGFVPLLCTFAFNPAGCQCRLQSPRFIGMACVSPRS